MVRNLQSVTDDWKVAKFYGACTKVEKPFFVSAFYQRGITFPNEILSKTGSLRNVVEMWTEQNSKVDYLLVIQMAIDSALAINFLHSKHIIHRLKCRIVV